MDKLRRGTIIYPGMIISGIHVDLRALDVSQNAITGTRRLILTQTLDPTDVMQALVEELKYEIKHGYLNFR